MRRRPSSNAAQGHGSRARPLRDPAPTGVPVAAGRTDCATTGEREAPRRSGLARARRPCVAAPTCQCELRHSSLVHYCDQGRGGRDGRALGRRRLLPQVLLADVPVQVVARSEQQATGHDFTGIGGSSRSTGRLAGCTPPGGDTRTRQKDRSAWRLSAGGLSALRLAEPSGCAPPGISDPNRQIRTIAVLAWDAYGSAVLAGRRSDWVRRPTGCQRDCHHRGS